MINVSLFLGKCRAKWGPIIFDREWSLTTNKGLELQVNWTTWVIGVGVNWNIRQDHAGFGIEAALFGIELELRFFDKRHWHSAEGRWEVYDDERHGG